MHGNAKGRLDAFEWQELFQAIGHPAVILDPEHRLEAANRATCEKAGKSEQELIGTTCWELFHGPDATCPPACCPMETLKGSKRLESDDMEMEAFGGVYLVSCTPVLDEAGNLKRVIHIATDITHRKQLEGQLIQAQKMEVVGRLAGGVAHDFNNILQAVLGHVGFAIESCDGEAVEQDDLKSIRRAGQRGAELVRQLLAFSRRQVLQLADFDLHQLVIELLTMVRRLLGEDIEIEHVSGEAACLVEADPAQIEQVVLNLCINARDAMPEGGAIVITTSRVEFDDDFCANNRWAKPGPFCCLSVADSGIGVSDEVRRQMFEPFFTTKTKGEGTGLGLATVQGIVVQHGGFINVVSEAGGGTEILIYLPISERRSEPIARKSERPAPRGTGTILVAEDDDVAQKLACRMLEKAGYTVILARDGQEAVELFLRHADEVSLALIDVVMPKLSGRQVLEKLREAAPDLPVLFVSGYSAENVHARFLLENKLQIIQKPYDRKSLLRKVSELLGSSKRAKR